MEIRPMIIVSVLALSVIGLTHSSAKAEPKNTVITLEMAISRAVAAAPSLRAGEENLRGTIAQIHQAGVKPNPEISLESEDFLGSGDFNGFDKSQTTLSIGQRFERGGKQQARISVAKRDNEVAKLARARARLDVIYSAQKAYVEVMAATAAQKNAQVRFQLSSDLEAAVKTRVDAALDSAAAAQRVALQALEARTNLDQAGHDVDLARRQLSMLWENEDVAFAVEAERLFAMDDVATQPNKESSESIPEIALSLAAQKKADAVIALEKARAKQDPTLSFGLRHQADSDDVAAVLSFSMPLALFDTNKGNIDRAVANRKKAGWDAIQVRRQLDREMARLIDRINAAKAEASIIRSDMIPKAAQGLRTTRHGYERGAFTYLEVLDAQRTLRDLQAREILALKKFHLTKAELDRLTARFQATFPGEEPNK